MVDIETTGTDPSHSHILQIAAVRFDIKSMQIDTSEMFNRCLVPAVPNRFWDESTLKWWQRQKPEILENILVRGEHPETVMGAFSRFAGAGRGYRFWSKPLSFDYPFIQSYFRQFTIPEPFAYWKGRDLNTFIYACGHEDPQKFAKGIEFEGDAHNAIFDVLHQIKLAFRAKETKNDTL